MEAELFESLSGRINDQLSEKAPSVCGTEEDVMAVLGHIDADQEILLRSPNLTLHLTKELEPAIIVLFHRDLLVRVIVPCGQQPIA
jgi:hypothetical protein